MERGGEEKQDKEDEEHSVAGYAGIETGATLPEEGIELYKGEAGLEITVFGPRREGREIGFLGHTSLRIAHRPGRGGL